MSSHADFHELLRRVRAGEDRAIRELIAQYEPFLRRAIRRRMARTSLRAEADSSDLLQSILGSLLLRLAAGEYVLATADDLARLLSAIVRNKTAAAIRRASAQRRDRGLTLQMSDSDNLPADPADEPSRRALGRELLEEVRRRLGDADRVLFQLRQEGHSWEEIAARLGESEVVLRKRLSRALRRVAIALGLENDDE